MTGPAALAFIDEEEQLRGGQPEAKYLSEVMPKKLALELQYAERANFRSDLGLLFRTATSVLRRATR